MAILELNVSNNVKLPKILPHLSFWDGLLVEIYFLAAGGDDAF